MGRTEPLARLLLEVLAWREGVGELCTFERGDLFKARVSDADAVALFVVRR